MHFRQYKTKSILFASKRRPKNLRQLNIRYKHKYKTALASYISCMCVSRDIVGWTKEFYKFLGWTNDTKGYKLNKWEINSFFIEKKTSHKKPPRILWNAIIQLYFDYVCPAWYLNLHVKRKRKIQIMKNKCTVFCLKLEKIHRISGKEVRLMNWLPSSKRIDHNKIL